MALFHEPITDPPYYTYAGMEPPAELNRQLQNNETSMEHLQTQVHEIRNNTMKPGSRDMYVKSSIRFIKWLYDNKADLLTNDFRSLLDRLSSGSIQQRISICYKIRLISRSQSNLKDLPQMISFCG
jgi:hypothetical protein